MKRLFFAVVAAVATGLAAQAQLQVTPLGQSLTPADLVQRLLGGGIVVANVQYTGATNASGVFTGGSSIIGFNDGIVLTSGNAVGVIGPNNTVVSTDNGQPGDSQLTTLAGVQSQDAAVLEFDFIPVGDHVQFQYVFGSEEYNVFVNAFNDVFGFFVNGVNFALIPNTAIPVSINTVNNGQSSGAGTGPCANCQFFIDNFDAHVNMQYGGLTTVLSFSAPVLAGQNNHMKIAIADGLDHALDSGVFIAAGSLQSIPITFANCTVDTFPSFQADCVTRSARFWFTHPVSGGTNCVSLLNAITAHSGGLCVGFLHLPTTFRNGDNTIDATDALIEALGFYWRATARTGDPDGTQSAGIAASKLCRARKQLAVELIAAMANNTLLGTAPENCSYSISQGTTNFPPDLIAQAGAAMTGDDAVQDQTLTLLLRKFNGSGQTNNFPNGLVECSPVASRILKQASRDPTTKFTCPGLNDTCASAAPVMFPPPKSKFTFPKFTDAADTRNYPSGTVWWKINPAIGVAGRQFTADVSGSNFSVQLAVWSGTAGLSTSNGLAQANCSGLRSLFSNLGSNATAMTTASFTTDGTNTFFIEATGGTGKVNLRVTSP